MIKLFIPTFNRSSKLARVLKTYSLWKKTPKVFVYDGSDDPLHAKANLRLTASYDFVEYVYNELPLIERYCLFVDTLDGKDIFFTSNDEDVFTESFCNLSFAMMSENLGLSSVIGSYLTFWPPLISKFFTRLSLKKVIPCSFSLVGSPIEKISIHMALNQTTKLPPLFYSPQRASCFKEYIYMIKEHNLNYSCCELLHQFSLLAKGELVFLSNLMILRDETRINHKIEKLRQGNSAYINPQDLQLAFDLFFKRSSDLLVYLKSLYSPPIVSRSDVDFISSAFASSYLTPISPMVFSDVFLLRWVCKILQGFSIRLVTLLNALLLLLISPFLSSSVRYFVFHTLLNPLPVNDRLKCRNMS